MSHSYWHRGSTEQTLDSFIAEIKQREAAVRHRKADICDVELYTDGRLAVENDTYEISTGVLEALARMADIPERYFCRTCDADLRALSFNRLKDMQKGKGGLVLVLDHDRIEEIGDAVLLRVTKSDLLDTIRNSIPADIDPAELRVITPADAGVFDVSIISPQESCEPREGDVVAFGVNVRETKKGAIQVHRASYRSACANDALYRVCDKNEHRLRRPGDKPGKQREFLGKFRQLATDAWKQRHANAADLRRMVSLPLFAVKKGGLESRLRAKPFFIHKKIVGRVMKRVREEAKSYGGAATTYEVWNAMSYLGTHDKEVSSTQRLRLRLGAGEIAKSKPRVCSACKQVVLG